MIQKSQILQTKGKNLMGSVKDNHLINVLESHKMAHVDEILTKYKTKRDEVKDALAEKFKDEIVTRAINSGSYAKHDAINIKFDLDVCQPFKRDSFTTLEEMADAVYDFFKDEYDDDEFQVHRLQKQRVSVGLVFLVDGDEVFIDVVPGRELLQDDYIETTRLNLFVRPTILETSSSIQTNIQKHIDLIKGKTVERNIIRLLKVWKVNHHKKYIKSFLLELLVIRAFDSCPELPTGLWETLKMVMEYIRDNIETIRLEDPANSNNVVSDTLTDNEKKNFSLEMKAILDDVEREENNLKTYFPVNQEFYIEEDEEDMRKAAALSVARSGVVKQPWAN